MGFFDRFRKKKPDDGTYHRDRRQDGGEEGYAAGSVYGDCEAFRMTVQDVFTITGRGTVVTGLVASGSITVGASVTLRRADGSTGEVTVSGIEMFRKIVDTAVRGDNVGLLLRGVERNEIGRGDILEKI